VVVEEEEEEEPPSLGNKGKAQAKGTEGTTGDVPNRLMEEVRVVQTLQPPRDQSTEEGYTTWKLLTHPPETHHLHSL